MKKIMAFLLILTLFTGVMTVSASDVVKVVVDGSMVEFDQPPVIIEGRTLVPVRAVAEKLGATVKWNNETQTVTVMLGDVGVALAIGNNYMPVTDLNTMQILYVVTLDVPPQNINGRTLMPIRALMEAFGCTVDWDSNTSSVLIFTPDYDPTKVRNTIIIGE